MQPPGPSVPPPEEEPEELARFRAEWKAELQKRRHHVPPENAPSTSSTSPPLTQASAVAADSHVSPKAALTSPATKQQTRAQTVKTVAADRPVVTGAAPSTYVSPGLGTALAAYRQAVQHEQRGDLDQALILYRQAFRSDPNVDRAYHREEMLNSVLQAQQGNLTSNKLNVVLASAGEMEQLATAMQNSLSLKSATPSNSVVTGTLAIIVANFPENVKFAPENELEPVSLNKLPDELFVTILRKLDPWSVEKFARASKRARVLTLDNAIWRDYVLRTYIPPQVGAVEEMVPVIKGHLGDYRRVYIEHPRVRLDGVYIAICHYVRHGLSDNSWVNITHLITYHRYMRFFPNGQVLTLLANEEYSPQQVIPLLKPTLRMKGLLIGNWYLDGTTVYLTNLIDASGKFRIPLPESETPGREHLGSNSTDVTTRYVFSMSLDLRSRPVGRWNRMDMLTYDSVNVETGDTVPVALKHDRPFWFSKVRSYERGLV